MIAMSEKRRVFAHPGERELVLLTADQVAEVTGTKASWWRNSARERKIAFTFIAGSYRWSPAQVAETIAQFEVRPQGTAEGTPSAPRRPKITAESASPGGQLRARTPRRRNRAA